MDTLSSYFLYFCLYRRAGLSCRPAERGEGVYYKCVGSSEGDMRVIIQRELDILLSNHIFTIQIVTD